jgi:hypothetical protein
MGFVRAKIFFLFSVGLYSSSVAVLRVCKWLTILKLASGGEAKLAE